MPDIELQSILRIMCDIIGGALEHRKLYLQTIEVSDIPNCRANEGLQIQTDKEGMHDGQK